MSRVLILLLCLGLCPGVHAERLALVGGTLIDGTGAPPLANSVVLIVDSNIVAVGAQGRLRIPADFQHISTEGMTLLPGLWDTSAHLLYDGHPDVDHWLYTYPDHAADVIMPATAHQLLQAGVTSVRDTGAGLADILAVRRGITEGRIPGPKVFASGPVLVPTKGPVRPHMLAVDGADQASATTQRLIDSGVDLIRVSGADADDQDEMDAIVATAHRRGVRVVASGHSDREIRIALAAGVDELQHIGTDTPLYPEDLLQLIRERVRTGPPLYWNPTVGKVLVTAALAEDREWLDDPVNYAGLPADMEADVRDAIARHHFTPASPDVVATVRRKLSQLEQAGVTFVFGSDMGRLGQPAAQATWRELEAWVKQLGMDPERAIRWATADAADYVGMGAITGTVTPGKKADIIAVRGNLLRRFDALRNPTLVVRHGVRYR